MSVGRPNNQLTLVNEDEYLSNQARIEEAQAALDKYKAMNEAAKQAYDKKMELLRLIEAGKEAERQLLELSGTSSSNHLAIPGPSGQSYSPTIGYNNSWQSSAHAGGHQKLHAGIGTGYNTPPMRAYEATAASNNFHYYQQQRHQPNVQAPQANPVPASEQGQSLGYYTPQQPSANRRASSSNVKQSIPAARTRRPLSMQPVTPQVLHPSHQTRPQTVSAGTSGTSYGAMQPSAHAGVYSAAVPNVVSAEVSSNNQQPELPHLTTPSASLNNTAKRLEEQIRASVVSSDQSAASTSASLAPHYKNLANNLIQAEWLEKLIENWQSTAVSNSSMSLPNSTIRVYKADDAHVFLIHTDPKTKKSDYIPFSLFKDMKRSASSQAILNISHGSVQPSNPPVTSGQMADRTQPPITQPQADAISTPVTQANVLAISDNSPSTASSAGPPLRTPKDVNKKSLAKSIIRALNLPPSKTPRLEESKPNLLDPSLGQSSDQNISIALTTAKNDETEPIAVSIQESSHNALEALPIPSHTAAGPPPDKPSENHYRPHVWQASPFVNSGKPTEPSLPSTSSHPSVHLAETAADAETVGDNVTSSLNVPRPVTSHSPQQKTPLFLPSLPASPAESEMEDMHGYELLRQVPKFYIQAPPLPDYVKEHKAWQLRRKRRRISTPLEEEPLTVEVGSSDTIGGEGIKDTGSIDVNPACSGFVNDESERQAVILSCSRVSEKVCKWNGCGIILGSAEKLLQHLAYQHGQQSSTGGLSVCMWPQCGQHQRNMKELFRHIRSHAILPLWCAFRDCQRSFRTPRQLANHHLSIHGNDELRSSISPFKPTLAPPEQIPQDVPSYLVEPIGRASISKERRVKLKSWVLRRVAGPVSEGIRPYNAASKPSGASGEAERRAGSQPYDFLTHPSVNLSTTPSQPARIRDIEDLDSSRITEMAFQESLVLWPAPEEQKVEEASDEQQLSALAATIDVKSDPGGQEVEMADETVLSEHSHDEQAVEVMLSNVKE